MNKQFLFLHPPVAGFLGCLQSHCAHPWAPVDLSSPSTVAMWCGFRACGFFHLPPSHMDTALTCLERTISYPPIHCWSWSSDTLATWCEELTHLKRPWCWERVRAGGKGDDRGWDGWMASLTQWTWVWVDSGSWWWTGKPTVPGVTKSQTWLNDWTEFRAAYAWHGPHMVTEHTSCPAGLLRCAKPNKAISNHPHSV